MCDVPSIAVFCGESIECFPGTVSKFFFKLLVTVPVAPVITGTIVHFRFHIRCISIHKLLYFNFFFASFCTTFLPAGIIIIIIYLAIVKSTITYAAETWCLKAKMVAKLNSTEMDFWQRPARLSRKDKIRNTIIKQMMIVTRSVLEDINTKQLKWYGHVQ